MEFFILATDYFNNGDFTYYKQSGSNYHEFDTQKFAEDYAKTFYPECKYKVFSVKQT